MISVAHSRREPKSMGQRYHSCCFYKTEPERRTLLSSLTYRGSDQSQQIIYVNSRASDETCSCDYETGPETDLFPSHYKVSLVRMDRAFVPDELIASLQAEIEMARAEGDTKLQIICEIPCPTGAGPSAGRLMEFESKLDILLLDTNCDCTCFYDMSRVGSAFLLGVMSSHPTVVIHGEHCDNLYYIPPIQIAEIGRPSATLQRRLENLEARNRVERSVRFLAEAGAELASSLDYETTLQNVLHSCVPFLADWCVVDIIEGTSVHRVAVSASDQSRETLLRELARLYPQPSDPHPIGAALATSRSVSYPDVSDSLVERICKDERHLKMLSDLGTRSVISVPLTARGSTFGVITLATAESGRRYGETDLALAEELGRRAALAVDNARLYRESQLAIQARDEFLSAASHELKTPVTSLRGFAQLTMRRHQKSGTIDPQDVHRALAVIDQQSDRLARLVDQLLDVSRIQAGQLTLERQFTDICALVAMVVANAQEHCVQHVLSLQAPAELLAMVDSLRLEQVITNLIDNAMKYSPDGGPINIDVSATDPDTAQISVTDNGIGIIPEHRQRIFDRFYRAHTDGHYGGIGLGLYISRQIIDLHGGRIDVECPPEGGACFVVSLPTNFRPRGL